MLCQSTTKAGEPCRRHARAGSRFCWVHDPDYEPPRCEFRDALARAAVAAGEDMTLRDLLNDVFLRTWVVSEDSANAAWAVVVAGTKERAIELAAADAGPGPHGRWEAFLVDEFREHVAWSGAR